jgi:hypothetical protein
VLVTVIVFLPALLLFQIRSSPSGLNAPIAVWLAPWSQQEAVSESEAAWQTHPEPEGKQEQEVALAAEEVALAAEEVALTAKEVALTAKEVTAQERRRHYKIF